MRGAWTQGRSIQRVTIIIFAVALAAGLVICNLTSYGIVYREKVRDGQEDGQAAAKITMSVLDSLGLDVLSASDTSPVYDRAHEILHAICKQLSLDYLCIYTVDDADVRHYVITVAADDAADRRMRSERGLGATSDDPLDAQELAALAGGHNDDPVLLDNQFGSMIEWVTPYVDDEGSVVALIGTDIATSVNTETILRAFAAVVVPFMAVLSLTFAALFVLIVRRVIAPIRTIATAMIRFDPARETAPLTIGTHDEMQLIADAFEKMSREIRTYVADIVWITKEREQEQAELDIARRIQEGMVPKTFEKSMAGVDVAAVMRPAHEVGGDFYDVFALDDGRICAVVGDVSGKGVAGAMFMALTKTLLRERLRMEPDPAAALNTANDELCAENPEGLFVTVFALVLDPVSGEVTYANAGHNPPVWLRSGTATPLVPDPGIALGLFEDAGIENETLALEAGEGIVLYTDGITEAVDTSRSFFGPGRLLEVLGTWEQDSDAEALLARVRDEVRRFSLGTEQFDDMTLVALLRRKDSSSLVLPTRLEAFSQIRERVLELSDGSPRAKMCVLACDEAFTNIVSYAQASTVTVTCEREGDTLEVTLADDGVAFDPLTADAMAPRDFDELDDGGMGISFIRSIADDLAWERTGGRNVLTMRFTL